VLRRSGAIDTDEHQNYCQINRLSYKGRFMISVTRDDFRHRTLTRGFNLTLLHRVRGVRHS